MEYTPAKRMKKCGDIVGGMEKIATKLNKAFKAIEDRHKKKKNVEEGRKEVVGTGDDSKKGTKLRKTLFKCPSNKKHKLIGCKKCPGCKQADCDACVYCMDKPRNGGKLVLKQKCKKRVCNNPVMGTCALCKSEV